MHEYDEEKFFIIKLGCKYFVLFLLEVLKVLLKGPVFPLTVLRLLKNSDYFHPPPLSLTEVL